MSEQDKNLNIEAFAKPKVENNKYTIFAAINNYEIGIDNLNLRLVVHRDIFLLFNLII